MTEKEPTEKTVVPPEDPAEVKKRDKVEPEYVGRKKMATYLIPTENGIFKGKRAPKNR